MTMKRFDDSLPFVRLFGMFIFLIYVKLCFSEAGCVGVEYHPADYHCWLKSYCGNVTYLAGHETYREKQGMMCVRCPIVNTCVALFPPNMYCYYFLLTFLKLLNV